MKKQIVLAAAVAMALSSAAYADKTETTTGGSNTAYGGTGGTAFGGAGGTGIGVGLGYGQGGAGGAGGQGGQGGEGGKGGVGYGGAGGSVLGSGNSNNSNRNDNTNTNLQGQQQGQGQAQGQAQGQQQGQVANGGKAQQGQSQSSRNNNQSSASNRNSNENSGNNAQTNVSVQGDNVSYQAARIPVATAYAPNIVATALCKFGVSGGGQGMTFGFSLGVSITDENCMLLEQVRTVSVILGQKEVAQEMMMVIPAYADAVKRLKGGTTAPAAAAPATTGAGVAAVGYNENDPIIRSRLGLPPLASSAAR